MGKTNRNEYKEKRTILIDKIEKLRKIKGRIENEDGVIDKNRNRDEYQRDYSRLIYSSSFRRLQGKMQLIGVHSGRYYRNRLTHSLEVSQIARSLSLMLSRYYGYKLWLENELFIIETISLAHDLGNPPFGHAGETILDDIMKDDGGFEGNAQTLRILLNLEKKFPNIEGINLSKRSTMGLVKYFYNRNENSKKFIYESDYTLIKKIREENNIVERQTLDCQIMDIADEIAYSAHDLEDVLHLRLMNPYDLVYMFKKELNNRQVLKSYSDDEINLAINKYEEMMKGALEYSYKLKNGGDTDDIFEAIFRKEFTSRVVNCLITDVDFIIEKEKIGFKKYECLANGLKKLLFDCIKNDGNQILYYEKRGENIIRGIYEALNDKNFNKNNQLLSSIFKIDYSDEKKKRYIVDYIAGMMDSYAIEVYENFYGKGSSEIYYQKK